MIRNRLRVMWDWHILLLLIALGGIFGLFIFWTKVHIVIAVELLIAAIGALLLHLAKRHRFSVDETAPGKPTPIPMGIVDLAKAEDYVDKNFDPVAIDFFARVLTSRTDYLLRVDVQMQIEGRQMRSETRSVFRGLNDLKQVTGTGAGKKKSAAPPAYKGPLLVPLVSAQKGSMFDNFRAVDRSGVALPTVPQWQVYGLIVVVLRALFERAIAEAQNLAADTVDLTVRDRSVLLTLIQNTVCATDAGMECTNAAERLAVLNSLDGRLSPQGKVRIRQVCESLVDTYLIVVETDRQAGDSLLLDYTHTIYIDRPLHSWDGMLRAKHGLMATEFDIYNAQAFQAGSYHFTLSGAHDLYVYDHHLEQFNTRSPVRQEDFVDGANRPYVRVTYKKARSVAHLYVRRQGDRTVPDGTSDELAPAPENGCTVRDIKSIVRFKEVPPGGLGNAVTVALVTAVMVTYFAVLRVGIDPTLDLANRNDNQDIPALMLTIPAFLAAAVGRSMSGDRLLTASLTAFYGLWTVVSISLGAVLLYIYSANRPLPFEITLPIPGRPITFNLIWIGLALLSIGVFLYLRKRKNDERRYYLSRLTGEQY